MSDQDKRIVQAYDRAREHAQRKPHPTVAVRVWADIDEGIADLVKYLNTLPGVRTDASCQGTLGDGGPSPYRAYVMASWPVELEAFLSSTFDVEFLGHHWGYIRPRGDPSENREVEIFEQCAEIADELQRLEGRSDVGNAIRQAGSEHARARARRV